MNFSVRFENRIIALLCTNMKFQLITSDATNIISPNKNCNAEKDVLMRGIETFLIQSDQQKILQFKNKNTAINCLVFETKTSHKIHIEIIQINSFYIQNMLSLDRVSCDSNSFVVCPDFFDVMLGRPMMKEKIESVKVIETDEFDEQVKQMKLDEDKILDEDSYADLNFEDCFELAAVESTSRMSAKSSSPNGVDGFFDFEIDEFFYLY